MIVAVMFGLAATMQAADPASPPPDDDIVVIGERLKHLKILMKRDRGTGIKHCVVKPTSGDAAFDSGICETYLACVSKVETSTALEACMRPPLTELVRSWGERRLKKTQQQH